jgi:hypothetical protein
MKKKTLPSHEFAEWHSLDMLREAEYKTGPNVRICLGVWLAALLIRGRYCASEAMEISPVEIVSFIRKLLGVLTSDEIDRTLYLLTRIFGRYDGLTDESLAIVESLRSDRQRPL